MAFAYALKYDSSLKIIAKEQTSRRLNKRINEYRTMSGNEIIQTGYSLRNIFNRISENNIVCFLADQSANPDYSVYVNLFGHFVSAFSGPAKIALKKRPELLLAYGVREENYNYIINFEKIEYGDLTELNDENIELLTQRIHSRFEDVIRSNPGQWLWLHKRFKHLKKYYG